MSDEARTAFSSLDTASDPDDTEIVAAPGAAMRIKLLQAVINVFSAKTSAEVALEDGAGGSVLGAGDGATSGSTMIDYGEEGVLLTANTALNATVEGATGGNYSVWVRYQIVSD